MALLVINAPFLAAAAILLLLAGSFGIDAVGYVAAAWRATTTRGRALAALAALGNLVVVVLLIAMRHETGHLARGARLGPPHPRRRLDDGRHARQHDRRCERDGIRRPRAGDHPEANGLRDEIAAEEAARGSTDRGVILSFVFILFAIHAARMQADGILLGYIAPAVAVMGDMVLATLFTLAVVDSCNRGFRGGTRWIERRVWRWYLAPADRRTWLARLARWWLKLRLRIGGAPARGALFHSGGASAQSGCRPAGRGHRRGHGAGLGHELVLRYRELGVWHLELVGGIAHRRVA